jgi:GT2 family glycosyltransferase
MTEEAGSKSVSAIIPCYNSSGTILRAIESVHRQSVAVHEIIVVDDGSTDGSAELIETHYPDVTIIRQANAGSAAARNAGMRKAAGEFIALLDADDVWQPHRLATQLPVMEAEPSVGLVCGNIVWLQAGESVPEPAPAGDYRLRTAAEVMCNHQVPTSTVLLRRQVLDNVGFMDESLRTSQDTEYFFRLVAKGWSIAYCEGVLAVGFSRAGSSSTNYLGNAQTLRRIIEQWDPATNPESPVNAEEYARAYAFTLRLAAEYATVGGDGAQARELYRLAASRAGAPLWLRMACKAGSVSPGALELVARGYRKATGRRALQRRA